MREIALNILDIVENSVKAEAKSVKIEVLAEREFLTVRISDDGKGMSREFLARVTDPFATTRTTRKVGMGIPFFKEAAEVTGGRFNITSELGVGTTTEAVFFIDSIDREPLGDIADTLTTLLSDCENVDYILVYKVEQREFIFDTRELKAQLNGISISEPEILQTIREFLKDNINNTNGGAIL
ncbi:MAG TPA: ATP-binding protein [Clostridia bacterium]|nr:ATP-binding protein [Clostridia bacterium]